ncbi:hypothetical protein ACRDNQ_04860 [Palleronia sp. KMU-117]|uniref:hypothetical protein n=1 Tax=Palleronia sp. KMU-117 TaxID=3434108 RepID=UPI003D734CFF
MFWSLAVAAAASTVDFADFAAGNRGTAIGFQHGLVAATAGGSIIVYAPNATLPGACASAGARACRAEMSIIFFGPVTNLRFSLDPKIPAKAVALTLFDGTRIVAQGTVGGGTVALPVSGTSGQVTRAQLDFSGIPATMPRAGGSLRSITYDTSAPPLPGFAPIVPAPGTPPPAVPPIQTEFLDFSKALGIRNGARTIRLPGATVSLTAGDGIFVYRGDEFMPAPGGFCALDEGFNCLGNALVVFDQLIKDLSFETYFFRRGDQALVRLFSGDLLLTERTITSAGLVSFFGFAGISHIQLIDQSSLATRGFAYGNFRYSLYDPYPPVPPVPLPAPALGLIAGLAMLAGMGFRRPQRRPQR